MVASRLWAVFLGGVVAACASGAPSPSPMTTASPSGSASTNPTPTQTSISASPSTPPATPSPTPELSWGPGWTEVALPSDGASEGFSQWVVVTDPGFAVFGEVDGWQRWLSVDGVSWDIAAIPAFDAAARKSPTWLLWKIVRFADMFVAVATEERHDHIQFWTSSDGADWTQVPDGAEFAFRKPSERPTLEPYFVWGCCGEVTDVRTDGQSLIVEGTPVQVDPCDVCEPSALVLVIRWSTADGLHWERDLVEPDYEFSGSDRSLDTAQGFIRPWSGDTGSVSGVEASADGTNWHVVWRTDPDGYVSALHPYSSGYLAVGSAGGHILAASSEDGITWVEAAGSAELPGWMLDFAESNARVVAVGSREDRPYVWVSVPLE